MSAGNKSEDFEKRDEEGASPGSSTSPGEDLDGVKEEKENAVPEDDHVKDRGGEWHSMSDVVVRSNSGSDGLRKPTRPAPVSDQVGLYVKSYIHFKYVLIRFHQALLLTVSLRALPCTSLAVLLRYEAKVALKFT